MESQFTVWAICFIDKDFFIPTDLTEWQLGSALFSDRAKALAYADELNEYDSLHVHSIIELHVF